MKKSIRIYKEKYRTLVLFTRLFSFSYACNIDSEYDKSIDKRIFNILVKNNILTQKNDGFLGSRCGCEKREIFASLAVKFGFSKACPIYNIPGFYVQNNARPCEIYQLWCRAFDNQFTPEELEYIEQISIKDGDQLRHCADITWDLMKEEHEWTWSKELSHLILFWKRKLFKRY